MKPFLLPLAALALAMAAFSGCATPSRTTQIEARLAAAGFQVIPATTPKQLDLVRTLAPGQLTVVTRDGKPYYVYPDATQQQLYVGQEAQYQAYQARVEIDEAARSDARAAQQSLMEARNDDLPQWNEAWGSWTGY
ncbi:MAG: hypothetical protein J0L84_11760 [Verrucomicrobia bacterium]|nr:hypothetical protein [Verrucomicrobiota bacterium]